MAGTSLYLFFNVVLKLSKKKIQSKGRQCGGKQQGEKAKEKKTRGSMEKNKAAILLPY